jgi:hypothetical protein
LKFAEYPSVEIAVAEFQRECTPSYYSNEGQVKTPWAILRPYRPGWTAFLKLLQDWRDDGRLEGLVLTS